MTPIQVEAAFDLLYVEETNSFVNEAGDDVSWDQVADMCVEASLAAFIVKKEASQHKPLTEAQTDQALSEDLARS